MDCVLEMMDFVRKMMDSGLNMIYLCTQIRRGQALHQDLSGRREDVHPRPCVAWERMFFYWNMTISSWRNDDLITKWAGKEAFRLFNKSLVPVMDLLAEVPRVGGSPAAQRAPTVGQRVLCKHPFDEVNFTLKIMNCALKHGDFCI